MRRVIALALVLGAALLVSVVTTAQTEPARLLVVDQDGDFDGASTDLAIVRYDGRGLRLLMRTAGREYAPLPSPDGRLIAVSVTQNLLPQSEVFVVARSGRGRRKLVSDRDGYSFAENWSPDGRRLLYGLMLTNDEGFVIDRTELWVVTANGRRKRRLSRRHGLFSSTWRPTGDMIAFTYDRGLHVVRPDGSGLRRLTRIVADPQWSPDGQTIAFAREFVGDRSGVYVVDVDGGPVRRLARFPDGSDLAVSGFSRDGESILVGDHAGIALVPAVGGPLRWLTRASDDRRAAWSPDGTKIAFLRRTEVWVMNADGTGAHAVARPRGTHRYRDLAWLP
jgi:Tol biopolymer transport system component